MLLNTQYKKAVKCFQVCGYVLGLIHFLYGHCFGLLALH